MKFTDEMIAEDEKRWHARDVVTELGYCSTYMRDRRDITNLDIRFYAYIMRRAHEMLKAQEPPTSASISSAIECLLHPQDADDSDMPKAIDTAVRAMRLLKAQEAVKSEPKEVIYDDEHRSVYCPSCDNRLAGLTYSGAVALETEETPNYCWMCGQAVKW